MENNSKKQRKARAQKDTAIITGNPNDIVVVNPTDIPKKFQTEQSIQERVVGLLQRRKRAIQMRRSENKLQRRREMLKTRIASKEKLMQRAMRMAKQILRSRVAGRSVAKKYKTLNVAQKINIDKMVDSKSKMIKKIAMRLLPRIQAGERVRLKAVFGGRSTKGVYNVQGINAGDSFVFKSKFLGEVSSQDLNQFFNMYEASIGKNLISIAASPIRAAGMIGKAAVKTAGVAALMSTPTTAVATTTAGVYSASKKLADVGKPDTSKTSISKPIIKKTNINASVEWNSDDYLFEKACCCLRKKAEKYDMDYEVVKEVFEDGLMDYTQNEKNSPYQFAMQRVNSFLANEAKDRPGLWANIHAKRKRIESGSGERMRKPGSKGAPTKQNFVDAAESAMSPLKLAGEKPFKPSMSKPKGEWDPIHGKAPKKGTLKYDMWKSKISSDKKVTEETFTEVNQMTLARYASKVREKLATGKVSPDKVDKRRAGMKHAQMKLKTGQYNEATEKKTPAEKFKAGLKKAGYDPDAGAKRLLDLIAKQKKEREEREAKYKDMNESFVVDRAAGYSTTYTAADLGIKIQGGFALHPSVTEEGGAGDIGTDKLTNKYKKDTPGQSLDAFVRQMRAKRKANTPC